MAPEFVRIEHCDAEVGGGFRPPDGVVICHNHLVRRAFFTLLLLHTCAVRTCAALRCALLQLRSAVCACTLPATPLLPLPLPPCRMKASQEEVNHALTHELVHAYDHCRGKVRCL